MKLSPHNHQPSPQTPQSSAEFPGQEFEKFLSEFSAEDVQVFREWRIWKDFIGIEHNAYANMSFLYGENFRYRVLFRIQQQAELSKTDFAQIVGEMEQRFGAVADRNEVINSIGERLHLKQILPQAPVTPPPPSLAPVSEVPQSGQAAVVRTSVREVVCPYSQTISSNPPLPAYSRPPASLPAPSAPPLGRTPTISPPFLASDRVSSPMPPSLSSPMPPNGHIPTLMPPSFAPSQLGHSAPPPISMPSRKSSPVPPPPPRHKSKPVPPLTPPARRAVPNSSVPPLPREALGVLPPIPTPPPLPKKSVPPPPPRHKSMPVPPLTPPPRTSAPSSPVPPLPRKVLGVLPPVSAPVPREPKPLPPPPDFIIQAALPTEADLEAAKAWEEMLKTPEPATQEGATDDSDNAITVDLDDVTTTRMVTGVRLKGEVLSHSWIKPKTLPLFEMAFKYADTLTEAQKQMLGDVAEFKDYDADSVSVMTYKYGNRMDMFRDFYADLWKVANQNRCPLKHLLKLIRIRLEGGDLIQEEIA